LAFVFSRFSSQICAEVVKEIKSSASKRLRFFILIFISCKDKDSY